MGIRMLGRTPVGAEAVISALRPPVRPLAPTASTARRHPGWTTGARRRARDLWEAVAGRQPVVVLSLAVGPAQTAARRTWGLVVRLVRPGASRRIAVTVVPLPGFPPPSAPPAPRPPRADPGTGAATP
ncbi:hypothetical protein [Streptomyces chilikensis]|uniref:Uncharacterized protein n=1 Tax=Streptomyces chilikensis TaxID=1194079 RepID=A0ABV3EUG0_9ACTN